MEVTKLRIAQPAVKIGATRPAIPGPRRVIDVGDDERQRRPGTVSSAVRCGGDGSAVARHIMVNATASVAVIGPSGDEIGASVHQSSGSPE